MHLHDTTRPKRINLSCASCNARFSRPQSQVKGSHQFCCKDCHDTWQRAHGPRGAAKPNFASVTVQCDYCGKESTKHRYLAEKTTRHFCDTACKGAWQREGLQGHRNPVYSTMAVPCTTCGKSLERTASRRATTSNAFCDYVCYGSWRSKQLSAANSHLWKGGRKRYRGPNWKQQSKAARQRDNEQCQLCLSQTILQVHHIIPYHDFGYIPGTNTAYKEANHLDNLITLCASCHSRVERGSITLPTQ